MVLQKQSFMHVNKASVYDVIRRAEAVLGFPRRHREFEVCYIPSDTDAVGSCSYNANERTFRLYRKEVEASVFHEAIHYLMHQHGILFTFLEGAPTFYSRLLDETVACHGESEAYGSTDFMTGRPIEAQADNSVDVEKFIADVETNPEGARRFLLDSGRTETYHVDFMTSIVRHMTIERGYTATGNLDTLRSDVQAFYEFLGSLPPKSKSAQLVSVKALASRNANKLRKAGIQSKDLVLCISDAIKQRRNSYEIYFQDIVGMLLNQPQ